jgi:hypothetical protein
VLRVVVLVVNPIRGHFEPRTNSGAGLSGQAHWHLPPLASESGLHLEQLPQFDWRT